MIKIMYTFTPCAMLLHWEQALHLSIHKIKLHAYVWQLSLKIASRIWGYAKRKEIKDAYPKKVCHMPWHVKKKEKEKDSPYPKERKRWFILRSSYTIHQKYPHTCTSWSRFMTCFSFGSGLWLSKIWEASMPSNPPYLQVHQKQLLEIGWGRKVQYKALVRNYTHRVIREIIRETL